MDDDLIDLIHAADRFLVEDTHQYRQELNDLTELLRRRYLLTRAVKRGSHVLDPTPPSL